MERPRVIAVDDDGSVLETLQEALAEWGYDVTAARSGPEALAAMDGRLFAVALVDVWMPGMDGLGVLREVKRRDSAVAVVMMTGDPTVATVIEALREGAYDYLVKPLKLEEVQHLLRRLLEHRFLRGEVTALRRRLATEMEVREIVGVSPQMAEVRRLVERAAAADAPVFIEGETGTGKELVAVSVHRLSGRREAPFVPVNCGAISPNLLESEFFGHVRGAFSGAVATAEGLFRAADGGTLFLDELAELPQALQVKLLRALQEKEVRPVGSTRTLPVDVRVVAATNRNPEEEIRKGSLRQDLFYRLNVIRIGVAPLRERKMDVPVLVSRFLRQFNERYHRDVPGVAPEALAALMAHDFPGNVRELENLVERAFVLGARGELGLGDLPSLASVGAAPPAGGAGAPERGDGGKLPLLADVERELILRAMRAHGNDKVKAARAIGVSQRTIYRRLKEYGLS